MKKILFGILTILILVVIVYFFRTQNKQSNITISKIQTEETNNAPSSFTREENNLVTVNNELNGIYTDYSASKLTDNINIIFFAADWCPSCRTLDKNISNNLDSIPSNITILKANYDNEQDLKVKYGVTIQHTLVQVDKNGNKINQWNGLYNLSTLQDILNIL